MVGRRKGVIELNSDGISSWRVSYDLRVGDDGGNYIEILRNERGEITRTSESSDLADIESISESGEGGHLERVSAGVYVLVGKSS